MILDAMTYMVMIVVAALSFIVIFLALTSSGPEK